LLIVPDPNQSPITVRVPTWFFPLLLALVVALFGGMAVFAVNAYMRIDQLQSRLAQQDQVRDVSRSREQEMRRAILSQRDEAKALKQEYTNLSQQVQSFQSNVTTEVESFQADVQAEVTRIQTGMNEIDRLMDEIRSIVGLPATPTPTPAGEIPPATPPPDEGGRPESSRPIQPPGNGLGGGEMTIPVSFDPSRVTLNRDSTLEQLRDLEAQLPAKLAELQQLKEQVAARVAQVDPAKRSNPAEIEQQLRLIDAAPKGWPVYGDLTSDFGPRWFLGRKDFHTGLDIGVWYRTPVRVTQDGEVVFAGWQRGFGWTVEVQHAMGFSTLYGHLSRYMVNVGDKVKAGDIIALTGVSGNSTGPHLHYEIRIHGIPVDPTKYVKMNK
jgi:murein DD-endopeptidase MepM/ murein hydrolase activator NlpD